MEALIFAAWVIPPVVAMLVFYLLPYMRRNPRKIAPGNERILNLTFDSTPFEEKVKRHKLERQVWDREFNALLPQPEPRGDIHTIRNWQGDVVRVTLDAQTPCGHGHDEVCYQCEHGYPVPKQMKKRNSKQ